MSLKAILLLIAMLVAKLRCSVNSKVVLNASYFTQPQELQFTGIYK